MSKVAWSGEIAGVQPRIDLLRSFGYLLLVNGTVTGAARDFTVRIGPGTQAKQLRAGTRVSGSAETVSAPERETAELCKVSALGGRIDAGR